MSKSQVIKHRKAIALEVLVKFDNTGRECPPLMPFDISTNKTYELISAIHNKKHKNTFDFPVYEAPQSKQREDIFEFTRKNAREQEGYLAVLKLL